MTAHLKNALVNAEKQAALHAAELRRRCRVIADDGDEGMAYILDALDAAEKTVAELRQAVQQARNGRPRRRRRRKKSGARARKPTGPSLSSAQDEAIKAVPAGGEMTVRGLFKDCQNRYPGRFPDNMLPGFTSTFSKKRRARGDIVTAKPSIGSKPAVYKKVARVQPGALPDNATAAE